VQKEPGHFDRAPVTGAEREKQKRLPSVPAEYERYVNKLLFCCHRLRPLRISWCKTQYSGCRKERNAKSEEETKMKELSMNEMNQVIGGYDTYVVVKGDTLYKISRRYGVTVNDLVRWNGIKNRNLIHPGQVLKIY
jgi:bacteriocin-like protein